MSPNENPIAAHHLIAALIQIINHDCETSIEWKLEGHPYFAADSWPERKTYDLQFRQRWRSSSYQLLLFLFTTICKLGRSIMGNNETHYYPL